MSTFSVIPADLQGIAVVFGTASSDVAHLQDMLASGAGEPESTSVIGSGGAAGSYTRILKEWGGALERLASSLETLSHKASAAANLYTQTESGNTMNANA